MNNWLLKYFNIFYQQQNTREHYWWKTSRNWVVEQHHKRTGKKAIPYICKYIYLISLKYIPPQLSFCLFFTGQDCFCPTFSMCRSCRLCSYTQREICILFRLWFHKYDPFGHKHLHGSKSSNRRKLKRQILKPTYGLLYDCHEWFKLQSISYSLSTNFPTYNCRKWPFYVMAMATWMFCSIYSIHMPTYLLNDMSWHSNWCSPLHICYKSIK